MAPHELQVPALISPYYSVFRKHALLQIPLEAVAARGTYRESSVGDKQLAAIAEPPDARSTLGQIEPPRHR